VESCDGSTGPTVQEEGVSEDMARGRFLSESIARDIRLNSLSIEAQLVYLMTVPHLDRDGLIEGDVDVLYGTVCPKRRVFIDRMGEFVQEWVSVGLVATYDTDQGSVLWFKGFGKNQTGMRYERETPSRFPLPPGHERNHDVDIPAAHSTTSGPTPEVLRKYSGSTPEVLRHSSGTLSDASGICRAQVQVKGQVQVQVQDQVEVQVEGEDEEHILLLAQQAPTDDDPSYDDLPEPKSRTKKTAKRPKAETGVALTSQQELFGAVCEAVGWDYRTLTKSDQGQVARTVGALAGANYTVDDIRRFITEIWSKDWRWKKNEQLPTLSQLRQDIGKINSIIPSMAPTAPKKGLDRYHEMLRERGIGIG
jgi:hypothetical protein